MFVYLILFSSHICVPADSAELPGLHVEQAPVPRRGVPDRHQLHTRLLHHVRVRQQKRKAPFILSGSECERENFFWSLSVANTNSMLISHRLMIGMYFGQALEDLLGSIELWYTGTYWEALSSGTQGPIGKLWAQVHRDLLGSFELRYTVA